MAETAPQETTDTAAATEEAPQDGQLRAIARDVLKIRVPVRVTLASQRKSVKEITEMGPGSIIKFDKTCEEPLELSVGDCLIAHGQVVKVGDKFGLKISALVT